MMLDLVCAFGIGLVAASPFGVLLYILHRDPDLERRFTKVFAPIRSALGELFALLRIAICAYVVSVITALFLAGHHGYFLEFFDNFGLVSCAALLVALGFVLLHGCLRRKGSSPDQVFERLLFWQLIGGFGLNAWALFHPGFWVVLFQAALFSLPTVLIVFLGPILLKRLEIAYKRRFAIWRARRATKNPYKLWP